MNKFCLFAACVFAFSLPSLVSVGQETKLTSVVAADAKLKLVGDDYKFTEGPAVNRHGDVFFTDQPNDRILRWSNGKIETWLTPAGRSNGLFFDNKGNLLACADGKNELWSIGADKNHKVLLKGFDGKLFNGPNDVWVNKGGDLYFTDPYYKRNYWKRDQIEAQLPRRVYRLESDRKTISVAAEDFVQPNGIVGDAEKKILYVADIGDKKTYRFQIDDSGKLVDRKLFCEMGSDGMTLDTAGNLYLTGRGVTVFNSKGEKLEVIDIPEGWTANVCFGGRDRNTLFVTASDSLYTLEMNTKGL